MQGKPEHGVNGTRIDVVDPCARREYSVVAGKQHGYRARRPGPARTSGRNAPFLMNRPNPGITMPSTAKHGGAGEHSGSASWTLSGRAVLGAWLLSAAVHTFLFLLLLFLVFPFGRPKEATPPDARVEIVGPIDAPTTASAPTPRPAQHLEAPAPKRLRPPTDDIRELARLTTLKRPDLSIIGIGAGGGTDETDRFAIDLGLG
ncbi:MAG: hypothetical protein D6788_01305, partial [Planctomycetota bacterium]